MNKRCNEQEVEKKPYGWTAMVIGAKCESWFESKLSPR